LEIAKFVLGFIPWILFLVLPTDGWNPLRTAVLICLVASIVFAWTPLRKGFILQWATVAFFLFSAVSLYCFRWIWLAEQMGIIANGFLTGVIWFTVLIGRPFTLQLARADLPRERWYDESLIRGCRFIAVFWGILLLIPTVASVFRQFCPKALSDQFYFILSLVCIAVGILFTSFYKRMKRKQRQNTASADLDSTKIHLRGEQGQ
jgi:carotenoid cleavage dioxygenase